MEIQPLGTRVLIKKDKPEEKTAAGVFIPQENKSTNTGEVINVGTSQCLVKVGQKVMLGPGGSPIMLNGEVHVLIEDDDILAIIKD